MTRVYVLAWKVPDGFVQTSEAKKPSSYLQGITATETKELYWTLERKGKRERKSLEALGPGCHDLYLFHLSDFLSLFPFLSRVQYSSFELSFFLCSLLFLY
jgi:hypothetical protein